MSHRARLLVVVLWLASLVATGAIVRAQAIAPNPLPEPILVSGEDLAFRVEQWIGGRPAGRLVVRVEGRWLEAQGTIGLRSVR